MPKPARFIPPGCLVEITARTVEGRCLLRPTAEFTRRTNGILGRALHLFPVALHGYVFMSNHVHIEAAGQDAETLAKFESHVLGNTARVAQELTGWKGQVWERCEPIPIVDDDAAEQRQTYILANGTKEGLVASPLEWPGPSSAMALVTGKTVEAEYDLRRDGRTIGKVTYPVTLTPLPSWAALSAEERQRRARSIVEEIEASVRTARGGAPPLGVEKLLQVDPYAIVELERRPAPLCHAVDDLKRTEFLQLRRAFLEARARASKRFREAPKDPAFPQHSFLPPSFRSDTERR
jgi:hypothetical protein